MKKEKKRSFFFHFRISFSLSPLLLDTFLYPTLCMGVRLTGSWLLQYKYIYRHSGYMFVYTFYKLCCVSYFMLFSFCESRFEMQQALTRLRSTYIFFSLEVSMLLLGCWLLLFFFSLLFIQPYQLLNIRRETYFFLFRCRFVPSMCVCVHQKLKKETNEKTQKI